MNGFLSRRESGSLVLFVSVVAVLLVGAGQASAATLNVCPSGCPYTQIAPAVAAAKSGDTIKIAAGTYSGGIAIDVSVKLIGAGAGSTIISGGGSVLTIGVLGASSEPTVSIDGVTITGGVAHSSPESTAFLGEEDVIALGGGVEIPPNADFSGGATVTISHSVITGNRAAPTRTLAVGPPCPGGQCPFAIARGGGIDNWGTLTLANTTVSNNEAAGVASDADGGGISSFSGSVTLTNTRVTGNQAVAAIPNGRFAEGGGIFVDGGALTVRNSVVNNNSASLTSALPSFAGGNLIDLASNSGGIHVGDGVPTTVDNTEINGNSVTATDLLGEPNAFDAGMLVGDSPFVMRNSTISGNQVTDISATSEDVGSGGSALELDGGGTITNTRITGNTATAISPHGVAAVNGGLAVLNFNDDPKLVTMQNSVISGNTATASSTTGSATVEGGGIFNNSLLELRNVQVNDNSGRANGPAGVAQGGGIWNGIELSGPPVELTLINTIVTRNSLTASNPTVSVQGGGLFTTLPVTLKHSQIALNTPDQCFGC